MNACTVMLAAAGAALGAVVAGAGVARLRAPRSAAQVIERYGVVPASLARLLAMPLGIAEIGAGVALAWPASRPAAALAVLVILLLYTLAIALALLRGAAGSDCGCGGIAGHVPIGGGLLARNLVLCLLAGSLALLHAPAPQGFTAWLASAAVAAVALALHVAVNFLLARDTLLADD